MFSYIGRQPILNRSFQPCGYDILHRDNVTKNIKLFTDENLSNVFSELMCIFSLEELTGGLPATVGFTRQLLLNNLPSCVAFLSASDTRNVSHR